MKEELFNELVTSVKQGGAILRGDLAPARAIDVDGPARVVLQVAAKHPEVAWDVVRLARRQRRASTAKSQAGSRNR